MLSPGSVFLLSHSSPVSLGDSINHYRALARLSTEKRSIVLSVEVIPVEVSSQVLNLLHGSHTLRRSASRPDIV